MKKAENKHLGAMKVGQQKFLVIRFGCPRIRTSPNFKKQSQLEKVQSKVLRTEWMVSFQL